MKIKAKATYRSVPRRHAMALQARVYSLDIAEDKIYKCQFDVKDVQIGGGYNGL